MLDVMKSSLGWRYGLVEEAKVQYPQIATVAGSAVLPFLTTCSIPPADLFVLLTVQFPRPCLNFCWVNYNARVLPFGVQFWIFDVCMLIYTYRDSI